MAHGRDGFDLRLDDHEVRRPMPLEEAMRDDTLLVLKMNGETLPIDRGYPVRVLATGWRTSGGPAASRWLKRRSIRLTNHEIHHAESRIPDEYPALGPAITEMPVIMSVLYL